MQAKLLRPSYPKLVQHVLYYGNSKRVSLTGQLDHYISRQGGSARNVMSRPRCRQGQKVVAYRLTVFIATQFSLLE